MKTRIIVATLGERNTLKQTLKSIVIQNITDLEVKIVVPKVKSDYLKQIANEVNLQNFQLIEDEGKGLSAAINQGFSAAGDFE
jgi:glycosyltransferase involved in cell wall biosynthesis